MGFALLAGIVSTPATAIEDCALFLADSQVCVSLGDSTTCGRLGDEYSEKAKDYRCLVRDRAKLKDCTAVYIQRNTFVIFQPFDVVRRGPFFPDRRWEFYDEDKVLSTCRAK